MKERQFTPVEVAGIRMFYNDGLSYSELMRMFGLTKNQVSIAVYFHELYADVEIESRLGGRRTRRDEQMFNNIEIRASIARCKMVPKYRAHAWKVVKGNIPARIVFAHPPIETNLRLQP